MKLSNQVYLIVVLLIMATFGCSSNKNIAGITNSSIAYAETFDSFEKVNGDKLIKELLLQRFEFNKNIIKAGFTDGMALPKPKSIMNRSDLTSITFGKLVYLVKDSRILGVRGVPLTSTALNAINSRITKLDKVQQYCAEKTNTEYIKPNRDIQYIKTLDRQYFSSLKTILLITSNISSLSKKPNPSVSIEMSVASIKLGDETEFHQDQIGKSIAEIHQIN
ncbi:hypothetical protein EZ449_09200 [Pedobacter frigidisoli]|uniref:Uncharacterized protein n=1 Tax=Pedobacter frigidisoli TaxID=2530455 RepID=A0A4R0P5A1_9SPHI|nr:hypothetical protein [Pedobacter frigidisoli]TCD10513.1 hypothetical protein EZ449_09200 [Pedobacter frigidisoli]